MIIAKDVKSELSSQLKISKIFQGLKYMYLINSSLPGISVYVALKRGVN